MRHFYDNVICDFEPLQPRHAADGGEQRAHHPGFLRDIVRLALDDGFRAARRLDGGAGRAALGFGARDNGASRARARRALSNLAGLVARADAGRARRHCGLQDIAAHVGRSGAFGLEHVAAEIGLGRARRNGSLQDVFRPIDLGAAIAVLLVALVAVTIAFAVTAGAIAAFLLAFAGISAADFTGRLGHIDEALFNGN